MPEPTLRAEFAGTNVYTQVETVDGRILFFVDIEVEPEVVVSVGWDAARTVFGVYVNGDLIHPPIRPATIATTNEGDATDGA